MGFRRRLGVPVVVFVVLLLMLSGVQALVVVAEDIDVQTRIGRPLQITQVRLEAPPCREGLDALRTLEGVEDREGADGL